MVHKSDTERVYGLMSRQDHEQEQAARLAAVQAAHETLPELYDLTMVETAEAGALQGEALQYRIFKGSEAAPVTVGAI